MAAALFKAVVLIVVTCTVVGIEGVHDHVPVFQTVHHDRLTLVSTET